MFTIKKIKKFCITYKGTPCPFYIKNIFNLRNLLFGTVTLTTNPDLDKYFHFRYDVLFDMYETFSLTNGGFGKNVVIFDAYMSSSMHDDNNKKYILILGKVSMG